MADTVQVVQWTLAQACPLRPPEAVTDPGEALTATGRARFLGRDVRKSFDGFGIVGDVSVTSITSPMTHNGKIWRGNSELRYPCSGFLISRELGNVGGLEGLKTLCRTCPANATPDRPAGCAGTIYQHPDSPETQEQLEGIISRLGLEGDVDEVFTRTNPLWYGFWTRSPLTVRAAEVLETILDAMLQEDRIEIAADPQRWHRKDHLEELETMVNALRIAQRNGGELKMHLSLSPPGHTDLGYYTIFPHCPLCKAEARLQRWKERYPVQLYTCEVCGTQYPPAETASSEKDDFDMPSLRDVLGTEQFKEFVRLYLMQQGADEARAIAIIAEQEKWEAERAAKAAMDRARWEEQQAYVEAVLYAGLRPLDDEPRDPDTADQPGSREKHFAAETFEQLLQRCNDRGVKVTFMYHRSTNEDLCKNQFRHIWNPQKLLAQWRREGCNERFGAMFKVPEEELRRFREGKRA